ncbi:MAG: hypothetical protein HOV80_16020, partial [Polyangiaceae bacterium]|nr:hypothetical protein [Polyangiaceae bacterium]
RPPLVEAPAPAASPKWSQAYSRACSGSITAPVVSADGASVAFCTRMFDAKNGTFAGVLPIGVEAFVPGGRVVSNDYAGHWQLGRPDGPAESSVPGSTTQTFALSPGGRLMATVEGNSIVMRTLDPLKEVADIDIGQVWPEPMLGFLADGRAIALVPRKCVTKRGKDKHRSWTKTECGSKSLMVVEGGKLVELRDASDLLSIAFAAGGTRAVIANRDGERAVIQLPGGETVAKLPSLVTDPEDYEIPPMALDTGGKRVAFVDEGSVVVAALEGSTVKELARMDGADPTGLVFSPDATTLFVGRNDRMIALREGEPERPIAMPRYDVTAPVGFEVFHARCPMDGEPEETGNDDLCRERQRLGADGGGLFIEGTEMMLPEGHVKAFIDRKSYIDVFVTAVDAAEYPEKNDTAWAQSIVKASVWSGSETGVLKTIKMRGSRAFDYAEFWRDGCDPKDIYVSVFERGGLLYRVRIEVPPEHPQKEVTPLIKSFVDEPFGSHDLAAHAFAKPPPAPDGPC